MLIEDAKLAISGNKDAFVRIVKASETTMYYTAKAILQDDSDCADAIQESILKAFKSIHDLREPSYFKTWIIRIVINESKRIKSRKKQVIPFQDLPEHLLYVEGEQERFEWIELLNILEDDLKIPLILFYVEDIPIKEIANLLDLPEGTVKSRMYRGREKLSKSIIPIEGRKVK